MIRIDGKLQLTVFAAYGAEIIFCQGKHEIILFIESIFCDLNPGNIRTIDAVQAGTGEGLALDGLQGFRKNHFFEGGVSLKGLLADNGQIIRKAGAVCTGGTVQKNNSYGECEDYPYLFHVNPSRDQYSITEGRIQGLLPECGQKRLCI